MEGGGSWNLDNSAQWGLHNITGLEQHWHRVPGVHAVLAKSTTTIKHLPKHKNYMEEVKPFIMKISAQICKST